MKNACGSELKAQRTAAARAMKPEPASETPIVNPSSTIVGMAATLATKSGMNALNAARPDQTTSYGEIARIVSAQGGERDRKLLALANALLRREENAASAKVIENCAALAAALLADDGRRRLLERR
jgi:hypothetical protein